MSVCVQDRGGMCTRYALAIGNIGYLYWYALGQVLGIKAGICPPTHGANGGYHTKIFFGFLLYR